MEPISLLMEEKWLPSMAPLIERMEEQARERTDGEGLPVFVAPHDELKRTGFELTRGARSAFRRPLPTVADVLHEARLVAVLEDITNHTNVGAIFRSAAALGVDAVLASPACYDPLYRRAVRVSMGAVFQVPWTRIGDEDVPNRPGCGTWSEAGIAELHEHGFTCAAMALSDDSVTPDELNVLLAEREAVTGATGKARAAVRHRGRGALPRHHRPLRLHRAHPHGPWRRFPERGRLQRRGLLRLPPFELGETSSSSTSVLR